MVICVFLFIVSPYIIKILSSCFFLTDMHAPNTNIHKVQNVYQNINFVACLHALPNPMHDYKLNIFAGVL